MALIEEVKSNDNDGKDDGVQGGGTGTGTGGGAAGAGFDDGADNATPPSSKLVPQQLRGANRSSSRSSNAAAAAVGTKSDADLLEGALAYSRAGATPALAPQSPKWVSTPVTDAGGYTSAGSLILRRGRREAGVGGEKAEIRATAAALLRRLVVEKQETLRAHFHKIPFMPQLPDLPALGEVSAVLADELGYQSLGEQLGRLAPLLKDESTEVRDDICGVEKGYLLA